MEQIGKFNNLSKELRDKLPVLEDGQIVTYELLEFDVDHITKRKLFGGSKTLPGRDRIRDGKNIIDVGVPRLVEGDVVKKCEKFKLANLEGQIVGGRFDLNGSNVEHVLWHQFFSICNFNESNPNASSDVKKRIRVIDPEVEAGELNRTRTILLDALKKVDLMDNQEVEMFAASRNWDIDLAPKALKEKVGQYAIQNPVEFMKIMKDETTKDLADLGLAYKYGILHYDPAKHQAIWADNKQVLATLDRIEGKEHIEILNDHLSSLKNGSEVRSTIRKKIQAAHKKRKQGNKNTDDTTGNE
jgi:hypothetical protein